MKGRRLYLYDSESEKTGYARALLYYNLEGERDGMGWDGRLLFARLDGWMGRSYHDAANANVRY